MFDNSILNMAFSMIGFYVILGGIIILISLLILKIVDYFEDREEKKEIEKENIIKDREIREKLLKEFEKYSESKIKEEERE